MMMTNPCPCTTLQNATKIVAIIDVFLNTVGLGVSTAVFVGIVSIDPDNKNNLSVNRDQQIQLIITSVVAIMIILCQLALAIYLKRCANENYFRGCLFWLNVTLFLFAIGIINTGVSVAAGTTALDITNKAVDIVYRMYAMLVVYSFTKELTNGSLYITGSR